MVELKRQFYEFLVGWKARRGRECLLVKGARQIGKTFIIEKFGRENYESFIEINFALEPKFAAVFEGSLDVRSIRERLTALRGDVRPGTKYRTAPTRGRRSSRWRWTGRST